MQPKLEELHVDGYERVVRVTEKKTGLDALIAIHNTVMGPALGGTRIFPYASFQEGLTDVLRLSKGMTYKAAVSEIGLGGGKSVIFLDPAKKTRELLWAFAEGVNLLEGHYICAEDSGCSSKDVLTFCEKTPFVVGIDHEQSSGNPAPFTAWGTMQGIFAVAKELYGSTSLRGKEVVLQGVGSVGELILEHLYWCGAKVVIADTHTERVEALGRKFGARVTTPSHVLFEPCDILVPCAMGGVITPQNIHQLQCRAIVGCANNQLLTPECAVLLQRAGILYAPDYVVNAGGLINVHNELEPSGYDPIRARDQINKIYERLLNIFEISKKNHISTERAAQILAEHRLKYQIGKREHPLHFHHSAS